MNHWGGKRRRPMTDIFSRIGLTLGTFTSVGLKYDTALATQMESQRFIASLKRTQC